ncbi:MAG: DUF2254 family protein [candidate division Zixibacteria bacterium]|nr:DUF2254 family protein [candidate division Zixibacteria bacterium]
MKKIISKLTELFSRLYLIIRSKVLESSYSVRRVLKWGLFLIILSISVSLLYKYHSQIGNFLIRLNVDSFGNLTSFFPTLFITLGAATFTVLAITFSLSLFAIQQAAERYTPTILSNFRKDKINRYIFVTIASISFAFFLFALLPINYLLIYEVVLLFFFLIIIFYLLRKQYAHISNLIDPIYQIIHHHKKGIKLLNKIDKYLDRLIKAKVIRLAQNDIKINSSKEEERDRLRGAAIFRLPNLFNGVKNYLDEIYSLIQTYQLRKDYQVTGKGVDAVYSLVYKYIEVKDGTFMPSSPFLSLDYSHDAFLLDIFEKLLSIQGITLKDFAVSEKILNCLSQIAIKCTEIRYRTNPLNEYPHCILATGYMVQNIEKGLNAELFDIGIQGSIKLRNIGLALIVKGSQTDVNKILDYLSKIAMYGLLKPNTSYLIANPLKAYSILLRAILYSRNIDHGLLSKRILEKVQQIISLYVKIKEMGIISLVEMEFSLGDFVYLGKQTAMPYIFDEVYNKIQDPKTTDQDKKHLIKSIIDFGHEVWHFYDELSKYAAEKESFLIHYIDANIEHIAMVLLKFYQLDIIDSIQKKEILDNIEWIISNYWRIYHYHKEITKPGELQILDNLLRIGNEFNELSLVESVNKIIDIIVSIANSFLEKQKNAYGFDPIRILERATYLCILNGSEVVYTNFLKQVKDKFWSEYCKKYPEHKELLFNELRRIDPDHLRLNRLHLSFEDELLSQLKKEDIIKFVDRLRKDLEEHPGE